MFPTYQCLQKGVRDVLFCLGHELFAKTRKTWFLHTRFLHFLLITQDLNKKKFRTRFCKISAKNTELYSS